MKFSLFFAFSMEALPNERNFLAQNLKKIENLKKSRGRRFIRLSDITTMSTTTDEDWITTTPDTTITTMENPPNFGKQISLTFKKKFFWIFLVFYIQGL